MEQNNLGRRIIILFIIVALGFVGSYYFLKRKTTSDISQDKKSIEKKDSVATVSLFTETHDFENEAGTSTDKAASGSKSLKLSPEVEYGLNITKQIKEISNYQNLRQINVELKCLATKKIEALYVLAIDDAAGKNIFWDGKPITCDKIGSWCTLHFSYEIKPDAVKSGSIIKLYPWNKAKELFYIDDISLQYMGIENRGETNTNQNSTTNFFYDFETPDGLTGTESIKQTTAHSGKMACDLTGGKEYGPIVSKTVSQVSSSVLKKVSASVWVYPLTDKTNAVLTTGVTNTKGENIFWGGKGTENMVCPKNKWTKINAAFILPSDKLSMDNKINVNIWNKGRTDLIIDDLEIVYGENNDRKGEKSTIDGNSIYENKFVSQKNKPPFKTIYFNKQTINCSVFADFTPNEMYVALNFLHDKNKLEQLIHIKDGIAEIYAYLPESKEFKKVSVRPMSADSLLKSKKEPDNDKSFFTPTDVTYNGDYFGDNNNEILKYNSDWRFDMKLIEHKADGFNIIGTVDFKGYSNDYNPKYYEFTRIISGRFINANQSSLIVISCNCAAPAFPRTKCEHFKNIATLPNSVGVYSIEKK